MFNEGSSRSHTIMRLSVESSERPGPDADPRIHVARTLSFLNLIDLAGSESARVCQKLHFLPKIASLGLFHHCDGVTDVRSLSSSAVQAAFCCAFFLPSRLTLE